MKRLSIVMLPCIIVITIAATFLIRRSGASAALLPQRIHNNNNCGAWVAVPSPNVGTSTNFLSGVAAIAVNNVWVVGSYGNGNGGFTLVEHWNGKQWKVVPSPSPNNNGSLSGIAAITPINIWAVGGYNNGATLVEHWNGTSWSVVPSPNVSGAGVGDGLTAISAVSATDIWAVGTISGNTGYQTLFEHWNGTSWSIVPGQITGQLAGVTAIASNNVWAVGTTSSTKGVQTLVEHWNGTKWSVVNSSGPGQATNNLNVIAAISANNIWAAGNDSNGVTPYAQYVPLIEHWNGTKWSIVSSPQQGTSDLVNGIAAVSANNIWVVGDYRTGLDPNGPYYTLIEHWNGTAWSFVNSPSPGSTASDPTAATTVPGTTGVWAVGETQGDNNIYQTFTLYNC